MNLDFLHCAIYVHNGKGGKDRVVTLSDELIVPLQRHLENRRQVHDKDLAVFTFHMPWHENIPMHQRSGHGSTCFHQVAVVLIHAPV